MRNIKLKVAYDGTKYHGWQKQPGLVTVESVLEKAVENTTKEKIKLFSAGRTDKGVHAMGQVVNFYSNMSIDLGNLPRVVNFHLPKDISVVEAKVVKEKFHSRYDAVEKKYRYIIYNSRYRNPIFENRAYHVPYPLNIDKMREALKVLIGEHDFNAFMGRHAIVKDCIRTINRINIKKSGDFIIIDFKGKSFLKNMIRIIVGTAVEIGREKRPVTDMKEALVSKKRLLAGHTAPACGLYLMDIKFKEDNI